MLSFNLAECSTENLDKSKAETNNTITLRTMNKSQDQHILTIENLTSEDKDNKAVCQSISNKQSNIYEVSLNKENRDCNIMISEDLSIDFNK